MSQTEFIQAQERIGCSGAQLARWMGLSPLTIIRYRTGAQKIPGPVALAMKALGEGLRP